MISYGTEWRRRKRDALRGSGICLTCCKRPATNGTAKCDYCRDSQRNSRIKREAWREANGRCIRCGRVLEGERTKRCVACLHAMDEMRHRREARRRAAQSCVRCDAPRLDGEHYCAKHLAKRLERLPKPGMCSRCYTMPVVQGRRMCEHCYESTASSAANLYRERRDAGLCVRCGGHTERPGVFCERCRALRSAYKAKRRLLGKIGEAE